MIKYRGKARVTKVEIFFLMSTLLLFLGQLIDSNAFYYYYLFSNFCLAFCYLFLAKFILNPDGELIYTLPIIAGLGMFPLLLLMPGLLRLYSGSYGFILLGSFVLFLIVLLYFLLRGRNHSGALFLELILIRFSVLLAFASLLYFVPGNVPPVKQLKLAYVGQNYLLKSRFHYSEANHLFFKFFYDQNYSNAYLWADSSKILKLRIIAAREEISFNYLWNELKVIEETVEHCVSPAGRYPQYFESEIDELNFLLNWEDISYDYISLAHASTHFGNFLRQEGRNIESIQILNRAKLYTKLLIMMENFETDILFHVFRYKFYNYFDLNMEVEGLDYMEKALKEFDRLGFIDPYWKAKLNFYKAGLFYQDGDLEASIRELEGIIQYLESNELDETSEELLQQVKEKLELIKGPVEWKLL